MLALLAITTLGPLAEFGVLGVFLAMVWGLMIRKDKKNYDLVEKQNEERKEMYASQSEIIKEVVEALTDKNSTDYAMAQALEKLTEQLRKLREKP